jgi:hypothetical protein
MRSEFRDGLYEVFADPVVLYGDGQERVKDKEVKPGEILHFHLGKGFPFFTGEASWQAEHDTRSMPADMKAVICK